MWRIFISWWNGEKNKRKVKVLFAPLCPTLCNPMDCSPPGSSVHGILQARILEWVAIPFSWVAIPFSRGSSQPRDQTRVSCVAGRFFTIWATREAWREDREEIKAITLCGQGVQDPGKRHFHHPFSLINPLNKVQCTEVANPSWLWKIRETLRLHFLPQVCCDNCQLL